MDLRIGDVTGEEVLDDLDRELLRAGLAGASGDGALRITGASGSAKKAFGPATDLGLVDIEEPFGRISILAPACKSSLKTSLLPLATATWIGSRPLRSGVSIAAFAIECERRTFEAL